MWYFGYIVRSSPDRVVRVRALGPFLESTGKVLHPEGRLSLHSSQVAHQAGAYPGFCNMKRLRVFLSIKFAELMYTPGWLEAL